MAVLAETQAYQRAFEEAGIRKIVEAFQDEGVSSQVDHQTESFAHERTNHLQVHLPARKFLYLRDFYEVKNLAH